MNEMQYKNNKNKQINFHCYVHKFVVCIILQLIRLRFKKIPIELTDWESSFVGRLWNHGYHQVWKVENGFEMAMRYCELYMSYSMHLQIVIFFIRFILNDILDVDAPYQTHKFEILNG